MASRVLTMSGKAQATLVLEEAILDIVEERAPITVRRRLLTRCSFASVASVLDENLPDY